MKIRRDTDSHACAFIDWNYPHPLNIAVSKGIFIITWIKQAEFDAGYLTTAMGLVHFKNLLVSVL